MYNRRFMIYNYVTGSTTNQGQTMDTMTVSENPNNLTPGQLVKFVDVVDKGDETARFFVVELRGPRVLVADAFFVRVNDFQITPTFVYPAADLIPAK